MGADHAPIEPFRFYTRFHLSELTGLKASTIGELLDLIRTVPESVIYHHTHRFLQQHQHLSPEPPNDFAYWAGEALADETLSENLASIDTMEFSTIRALRDRIDETIVMHLKDHPSAERRFAAPGEEFHFIKSVSFVLPTKYVANDLREFAEIIGKITIDSIYYHVFEARLRLERGTNDFSVWIERSLGDGPLAEAISRLDPYTRTMENLRGSIMRLVERRLRR